MEKKTSRHFPNLINMLLLMTFSGRFSILTADKHTNINELSISFPVTRQQSIGLKCQLFFRMSIHIHADVETVGRTTHLLLLYTFHQVQRNSIQCSTKISSDATHNSKMPNGIYLFATPLDDPIGDKQDSAMILCVWEAKGKTVRTSCDLPNTDLFL